MELHDLVLAGECDRRTPYGPDPFTMKHGIQTTGTPDNPDCLYMRNLYHEFFWGPFADEAELTTAVLALDKADPYWDYYPFCITYGANPLPDDFVLGFRFADAALKERVSAARKTAKLQPPTAPTH